VNFSVSGSGPAIELRITKNEGIPIKLVRDDAATGEPVIAVKRVDELGFYSLGRNQLAEKVGLSQSLTTAFIWHLGLKDDADCHKEVVIRNSRFNCYSRNAVTRIQEALTTVNPADIWTAYRNRDRRKPPRAAGAAPVIQEPVRG